MNPMLLQTVQLMTNILGSDKITDEKIREKANKIMLVLLNMLDTDIEEHKQATSKLAI